MFYINLIMRKLSNPKLRDILQNDSLGFLKNVNVMKEK